MENLEDSIRLTEYGAAEEVLGSKLLLQAGRFNILVDMGLEYKAGEEKEPIPFSAKGTDCVVLTHGHADHMGQLLKLYKAGFRGKIFSTQETFDISKLQMSQSIGSAYIHNKWVEGKVFRAGPNKGKPIPKKEILYTNQDMKKVLGFFETYNEQRGFSYNKEIQIAKDKDTDIKATFYEAGHIPGSAQILFEITHKGKTKKLLTSFDLGRTDFKIPNHPVADTVFLRYPYENFPRDIDIEVIEATYGNKIHAPLEESIAVLEDAINYASREKGQAVTPAFSIMRMQMLESFIYRFYKQGKLPDNVGFFSSCPTSDRVWRIFLKYIGNFDEKAKEEFKNPNDNPFNFPRLIRHKKIIETLEVIRSGKPAMFFASSGMGSQGRAKTLLRETISNPKNAVLGTGYAAEGTVMWYIKEGYKKIPFGDEIGDVIMNAKYFRMGGLSGHVDFLENMTHVNNLYCPVKDKNKREPLEILIKHGEKENCEAQRQGLIKEGHSPDNVQVMKRGKTYFFKL